MSVLVLSLFIGMSFVAWVSGKAAFHETEGVNVRLAQFASPDRPSRWSTLNGVRELISQAFSSSAVRPVTAVASLDFVRSIGVNVHMGYYWTVYNNVPKVNTALAYLGVQQVRDKLLNWPVVQKNYQELAEGGAKFDFILPAYSGNPNTTNLSEFVGMASAFAQAHPDSVMAIEGANEVNIWPVLYGGGTTLADQAALQRAFYAAVRKDGHLDKIPVYNLTLAYTDASQYAQLGDLSRAADYANSHAYLNSGQTAQHSLGVILPFARLDAPGLPTVITEAGYQTNTADMYSGTDQTVQSKLTLNQLMDAFAAGVSRIYLYELFDEGGQEFGLFNADGMPKPAAKAIHNLTTVLTDAGVAHPSAPASLRYGIRNEPGNVNSILLGKSDGTFVLILWAESAIWNSVTKREIPASAETPTVVFDQKQTTALVFDPLEGAGPIASYHDVRSIEVALSDHPIIIEVRGVPRSLHGSK